MIESHERKLIRRFFASFTKDPLYDLGYAQVVVDSGLVFWDPLDDDLLEALTYLHGFADACVLATPPTMPAARAMVAWRAAKLMSIAASTFAVMLRAIDDQSAEVEDLLTQYEDEFAKLAAERRYA